MALSILSLIFQIEEIWKDLLDGHTAYWLIVNDTKELPYLFLAIICSILRNRAEHIVFTSIWSLPPTSIVCTIIGDGYYPRYRVEISTLEVGLSSLDQVHSIIMKK